MVYFSISEYLHSTPSRVFVFKYISVYLTPCLPHPSRDRGEGAGGGAGVGGGRRVSLYSLIWDVDAKRQHLILKYVLVVAKGALEEMYARVNCLSLKSMTIHVDSNFIPKIFILQAKI